MAEVDSTSVIQLDNEPSKPLGVDPTGGRGLQHGSAPSNTSSRDVAMLLTDPLRTGTGSEAALRSLTAARTAQGLESGPSPLASSLYAWSYLSGFRNRTMEREFRQFSRPPLFTFTCLCFGTLMVTAILFRVTPSFNTKADSIKVICQWCLLVVGAFVMFGDLLTLSMLSVGKLTQLAHSWWHIYLRTALMWVLILGKLTLAAQFWDCPRNPDPELARFCYGSVGAGHVSAYYLAVLLHIPFPHYVGLFIVDTIVELVLGQIPGLKGQPQEGEFSRPLMAGCLGCITLALTAWNERDYRHRFLDAKYLELERALNKRRKREVVIGLSSLCDRRDLPSLLSGVPVRYESPDAGILITEVANFVAWRHSLRPIQAVHFLGVVYDGFDSKRIEVGRPGLPSFGVEAVPVPGQQAPLPFLGPSGVVIDRLWWKGDTYATGVGLMQRSTEKERETLLRFAKWQLVLVDVLSRREYQDFSGVRGLSSLKLRFGFGRGPCTFLQVPVATVTRFYTGPAVRTAKDACKLSPPGGVHVNTNSFVAENQQSDAAPPSPSSQEARSERVLLGEHLADSSPIGTLSPKGGGTGRIRRVGASEPSSSVGGSVSTGTATFSTIIDADDLANFLEQNSLVEEEDSWDYDRSESASRSARSNTVSSIGSRSGKRDGVGKSSESPGIQPPPSYGDWFRYIWAAVTAPVSPSFQAFLNQRAVLRRSVSGALSLAYVIFTVGVIVVEDAATVGTAVCAILATALALVLPELLVIFKEHAGLVQCLVGNASAFVTVMISLVSAPCLLNRNPEPQPLCFAFVGVLQSDCIRPAFSLLISAVWGFTGFFLNINYPEDRKRRRIQNVLWNLVAVGAMVLLAVDRIVKLRRAFDDVEALAIATTRSTKSKDAHEKVLKMLLPPHVVPLYQQLREEKVSAAVTQRAQDVALLAVRFAGGESQLLSLPGGPTEFGSGIAPFLSLMELLTGTAKSTPAVSIIFTDGDTLVVGGPLHPPKVALEDLPATSRVANAPLGELMYEKVANDVSVALVGLLRKIVALRSVTAILHRGDALTMIYGDARPMFALQSGAAEVSELILQALFPQQLCATEAFLRPFYENYKNTDDLNEIDLLERISSDFFRNTAEQTPSSQKPTANESSLTTVKEFHLGKPFNLRGKGVGLTRLFPLLPDEPACE